MSVDFSALLSTKADEIEAPKPTPIGTYEAVVLKYETGESSEKHTPYVRFWIKPMTPQEDVDTQAFTDFGGQEALAKVKFRQDFYLTEDALYRLKKFLEVTLKLDGAGKSIGELLAETANASLMISVKQSLAKDNSTIFSEIGSMAAVG